VCNSYVAPSPSPPPQAASSGALAVPGEEPGPTGSQRGASNMLQGQTRRWATVQIPTMIKTAQSQGLSSMGERGESASGGRSLIPVSP
jgi:hypothetical protein